MPWDARRMIMKEHSEFFVRTIAGFLIFGFLGAMSFVWAEDGVFNSSAIQVTTDRPAYGPGETVRIRVHNRGDADVKLVFPFYVVERLAVDKWDEITRISCPCGTECTDTADQALAPGDTVDFEWNLNEEWCFRGEENRTPAPIGEYRVKVKTATSKESQDYVAVYSRNFKVE